MNSPSWTIRGNLATLLLALALVAAAVVAWRLSQVFLLMFAAIIIATVLGAFAEFTTKHSPLSRRPAVVLGLALVGAAVVAFVYLAGAQLGAQFGQLAIQVPVAIRALGLEIGLADLDARLLGLFNTFVSSDSTVGAIATYTGGAVAIATTVFLIAMAGMFMAMDPELYVSGVVRLVPKDLRTGAKAALDDAGIALRHWLLGQLLTCAYVGAVTAVVLLLLNVPAALALALIAGAMEFVPYVGPFIAAVPAVLLSMSNGDPLLPIWVAAAFLVIQQVEGNVMSPIVFHWAVKLPPALGLFSVVACGVLFGPLGVLLAIPLTVVLIVLTRHLYVRAILKDDATKPMAAAGTKSKPSTE